MKRRIEKVGAIVLAVGLLTLVFGLILSGNAEKFRNLSENPNVSVNATYIGIGENNGFEDAYPGMGTGIVVVPEKYDANKEITMEQLLESQNVNVEDVIFANGKFIDRPDPLDKPNPLAWAGITIRGEVKDIDIEGRIITFSDIEIYVGEEVDILIARGLNKAVPYDFSGIVVGDIVSIATIFQYGRGEPIFPEYLTVCR
jgi:hypothetical protein